MKNQPDPSSKNIRQLVPPMGACFITDRIAADGCEIGFMYRERPDRPEDSGWRFFSGDESQEYLDNPDHTSLYEVNTAANFDPDIVPLLETPAPCAFEKIQGGHEYQPAEVPEEGDESPSDGELHPEFPVVEGRYEMTDDWTVDLPAPFNQRIEEDQLVFWRPGFTVWASVWELNDDESPQERMASLKEMISSDAANLMEESDGSIQRLAYRLEEEAADGRQPGFYGFAVGSTGHVQMTIYFDDEEEAEMADQIWRSLAEIPKG